VLESGGFEILAFLSKGWQKARPFMGGMNAVDYKSFIN